MAAQKINITLQPDLLIKIDNFCKENGLSRSGFFAVSATQYLTAMDKQILVADAMGNMGELLKLALSGKSDSDEYAQALALLEKQGENLK